MARAESVRNNQLFLERLVMPFALPLKKTIAQVMNKMIAVLIAVARSEFTAFNPIFAKMAVSAAKKADSNAYNNQPGIY